MLHEWALAESIIDFLDNYLKKKHCTRVKRLVIKLGELQTIDKEVLLYALNNLAQLRGVYIDEIVFRREEVVLKCRKCGNNWRFSVENVSEEVREAIHFVPEVIHSFTKCPFCNSRDFDIISGRGLQIASIEVE